MIKKQAYRPLTESEKKYIDKLVNEGYADVINSVNNGYNQFHDWMHNRNCGDNNSGKKYDPINASPFEVYTNGSDDRIPTERSQWTQFRDWMTDRFTNGEYSKRKNDYLNQQMRHGLNNGQNTGYWESKLLNYWGQTYNKMVTGQQAASEFSKWVQEYLGNQQYNNSFMNVYIANAYGNWPISYDDYKKCIRAFGVLVNKKGFENSVNGFVQALNLIKQWKR